MDRQYHVLLAEDDVNFRSLLAECLQKNGCLVEVSGNGDVCLERVLSSHFDLLLAETELRGMTGNEVTATLRNLGKTTPVLLMSSKDSVADVLAGYEAGCDEYVIKPFSFEVLLCKIRAIIARTERQEENNRDIYDLGNGVLFDVRHQTVGNQRLSARESDLLLIFCKKMNQLVDRAYILRSLWPEDNYFTSRSLSVYINRLRNILSQEAEAKIVSVHGKGYKLVL